MKSILLENARLVLPDRVEKSGALAIEDGRIGFDRSEAEEVVDLGGATLYPGYIDIHIHGAAGVDVMSADVDGLRMMAEFLVRHGVTGWMPTFVPDAQDIYRNAVTNIDRFVAQQDNFNCARILGLHYEGPFVSEHQCGALKPQFFRRFETGGELSSLPVLSGTGKRMMTLAPEVSGGIELVKELVVERWVASIGHTRANLEILDLAADAGARHMTHFFNAMSGMHHRDVGVVGWGMSRDDITCDVIADGVHVNPDVLKILHRAKSADKISLISDSVLPAGMGDGDYEIWGEKISVHNGKTENERGSIAGSVITMLDAVRMMLSLGIAEHDVARMASLSPATVLGLEKETGSIEAGKRADLVALDENREVVLSMVGGKIAYRRG